MTRGAPDIANCRDTTCFGCHSRMMARSDRWSVHELHVARPDVPALFLSLRPLPLTRATFTWSMPNRLVTLNAAEMKTAAPRRTQHREPFSVVLHDIADFESVRISALVTFQEPESVRASLLLQGELHLPAFD